MKRPALALLVVALGAVACSPGASDESQPAPQQLALSEIAEPTTTTTTMKEASTTFQTLAPSAPTTSSSTTSSTTVSSTTSTTKVPTASGGGGTGKLDPFSLYTGILGFFGPDDLVTPAVGSIPQAAAGTAPLTGLAGSSPNRPAVVVKIDNGSKARPQAGLNLADIVIEEEVEWGITRLAAIFHSNQAEVGPVRSGRTTDISFLNSLGTPALVYSGANDVIDALLLNQKRVQNFSAARTSGFWRQSGRSAPSNLWANTASFTAIASGGPPPAQFHYRAAGTPSTAGQATSSIGINYPSATIGWTWDTSAWLRSQDGKAHNTNGQRVSAANVVVIEARVFPTGLYDSVGGVVPEVVWLGTGKAIVFTDGKRIEATWTRSTLKSPSVLTDAQGAVIPLTPGRTWVELTGAGATSSG